MPADFSAGIFWLTVSRESIGKFICEGGFAGSDGINAPKGDIDSDKAED